MGPRAWAHKMGPYGPGLFGFRMDLCLRCEVDGSAPLLLGAFSKAISDLWRPDPPRHARLRRARRLAQVKVPSILVREMNMKHHETFQWMLI